MSANFYKQRELEFRSMKHKSKYDIIWTGEDQAQTLAQYIH